MKLKSPTGTAAVVHYIYMLTLTCEIFLRLQGAICYYYLYQHTTMQ